MTMYYSASEQAYLEQLANQLENAKCIKHKHPSETAEEKSKRLWKITVEVAQT